MSDRNTPPGGVKRNPSNPLYVQPAQDTPEQEPPNEEDSEGEKLLSEAIEASIYSGSQLSQVQLPERAKVIGEWFREGDYGLIFGFRGLGKSWMGLGLAGAIATSSSFGPFKAHVAWPVLYIDGEMVFGVIRERIIALFGKCPDNLHVLSHEVLFQQEGRTLNLARIDAQEAILARCLEREIRVLILDNLSCLMSGIKENDADSWEPVKLWLLKLRRHRIAVIVIHHAGRSGLDLRGTSRREDDAFWIMRLEQPADEGAERGAHFVSRFTKNRNAPSELLPLDWTIELEINGTVRVGTVETSTADLIVQWVRDGLSTPSDIAAETGLSKGTISRHATRLIKTGRLKKTGREYELGRGEKQP